VKKKDLERKLEKLGWWLKRHGAKHDLWTNGQDEETVPRHPEINELLARKILKTAQRAAERKK
jgi:mRNA interferase HicA